MITPDPEVMGSSDWIEGSGYFEKFDGGLPPLGSSVKGYIGDAPTEFMKVIAVIPLNIIYNRAIGITIESWEDLCVVAETGRIITPPHDTPLPQLYRHFLNRLLGERAAGVIEKTDHALYPLDINKAVDEGEYGAGVVFPAFARSSRLGNVASCCPREGVIALPVVAVKRKGASEKADAIVRYLLGREFQEYLSHVGDMLPVLEGVSFPEGVAEDSKLLWDGWDLFKKFIQ
jgi:ABC-type Fe3+ transport system substrate-binding protein